ncbi:MAG: NADH-quinone oxidoreductase subunit N [Ignavibacteria bacterium]|nr:NADH-quinone oxidoreductase subunit N [Ignavibacteria bacterium]
MDINSFINILPILLITLLALVAILIEAFIKKSESILHWLTVIGTFGIAAYSLLSIHEQYLNFSGMIHSGGITHVFYFAFLVTTGMIALVSKNYMTKIQFHHGEYYLLLMLAALGMMVMASSRDLMLTFLGLELMSVSFYVLAGFNRKKLLNNEASLKYFLLGAFATGFLLYGIALIYGSAKTTSISTIVGSFPSLLSNVVFTLGLILFLIGLSFKIAAFPFHMWVPDVYEGSPTTVTAFMSTAGKMAAFAAIIVSLYGSTIQPQMFSDLGNILAILSVLSMLFGSIVALAQTNLKRMLAYSSIAHAGYLLIGIAAANKLGLSGVIYYLIVYAFMNIGAFLIISLFEDSTDKRIQLDDLAGLVNQKPLIAAFMAMFMFALSGLPPFGGFFGKYYVFVSAIDAGMTWLAVIGVLSSVIAVYFYLRVIIYMYFRETQVYISANYSFTENFVLVVSILIVLHMGIFPSTVLDLITRYL